MVTHGSMNGLRAALICLAFTLALGATPGPQTLDIRLNPLGASREHGTATLVQHGSGLVVTVVVTGGASGVVQFAHFHRGTCEHIAASTIYELNPIRNGHSTTLLVDVGFEDLLHGTYSVVIHKTLSHASPHVACGTISGA
jgi:hypothetical protein